MPILRRGGGRAHPAAAARLGVVAGLRLAVAPGLVLAGALVILALPERARRSARGLGMAVTAAAAALLLLDAGPVLSGGHVDHSLGDPVPGVALGLRLDGAGLAIVGMAAVAALAALLDCGPGTRAPAAIMICLLGVLVTGLAGSVLVLFAGLEIGNLGTLLLRTPRGRPGAAALVGFGVQHAAALGLLAVAVELMMGRGTTALEALPGAPLGGVAATLWAVAGAARLLAPAIAPTPPRWPGRLAWAAVAAAPSGLMVVVRLLQASPGGLPAPAAPVLAMLGAAAALGGAGVAARTHRTPAAAGRALCVALAGMAVAAASLGAGPARQGMAASAVALITALVAASSWSGGASRSRRGRIVGALALAVAGGLPLGIGTMAVTLVLGAAATGAGPGAGLLLLALGVAATLSAIAGARAAAAALGTAPAGSGATGPGAPRGATAGVALSLTAALLPGVVVTLLLRPLAGAAGASAADAGAVLGPGGGWSGGYLLLAALIAAAMVWSALVLTGTHVGLPVRPPPEPAPPPPPDALPAAGRAIVSLVAAAGRRLADIDRWLITQPQLLVAVAATVAAVLLLR